MLGSKLKSWMESQVAKVRSTKSRGWGRDEMNSSGVPSSCSNDTSILLGAGSSIGSFTQNLSSPDTGYSTDGYSPKSYHPPLAFTTHILPPMAIVSKTTLLTQSAQSRESVHTQQISSLLSSNRAESPRKPPRLSKIKQQLELEQEIKNQQKTEVAPPIRNSVASSGDSGQGTLGSNRNSGESFTQYRFPNISEEPRETEILSDWAPTDEDVDEGILTPTPTPPPIHTSPIPRHFSSPAIKASSYDHELPKAYETLQLLNQCNHVFPLPSCTGPRCLEARLDSHDPRLTRKRAKSGPLGFLKKFFRRKSSVERELPENSRGKPIRTGPTGYWLTPTPNSFRKRSIDSYVSTTIPKGVKSDIIRLPQTTPTTLATPTLSRQSPFLNRLSSNTASPASVRFKPPSVTPLHQSPRPVVAFALDSEPQPQPPSSPRPPAPPQTTNTRIQLPSFNNYSPIHRLVVTTGVHHHHHRPAPESPLVRIHTQRPSLGQNSITPIFSASAGPNPRYQYIPSSNQNSPILSNIPRRLSAPVQTLPYYASPLVQNSCRVPQQQHAFDVDRIYERVEGTEVSDEGDGEGGDYEWDVSIGESELSVSQGQESNRSRQSQASTQTFQAHTSAYLRPIPQQSRVPPMAWGTRLSEMEVKLLEKEADLKYKKLLLEAEVLLRQFTMEGNNGPKIEAWQDGRQKLKRNRDFSDECPQSDPLRRKTYDCWALRRLQQEMALSCASPPVLHRSRHNVLQNHHDTTNPNHHHHPSPSFRI